MTDFRSRLYRGYVSTFKSDSLLVGDALASYWRWCDSRLLPLLAGLPKSARILEIGCGPGYFLQYLRNHGFSDVRGVDISPEQVAIARSRGLTADVSDVFTTIDAAHGEFDAVVGLDFLEHFSKDECLQLCDSIFRTLRPGGRFVFSTPNGSALLAGPIIYGDLTHMAIYNQSSLQQLLASAGFVRMSYQEASPVAKNLFGIVRCAVWGFSRFIANLVRFAESGSGQKIWTQNIICRAFRPSEPSP